MAQGGTKNYLYIEDEKRCVEDCGLGYKAKPNAEIPYCEPIRCDIENCMHRGCKTRENFCEVCEAHTN